MQHLHRKIEAILQQEEVRRALKNEKLGNKNVFSFYDIKGEASKIRELLPELQRAINGGESLKVVELCLLINKRANLISAQYTKEHLF